MATQDWGLWMHAKFLSSTCLYKFTSTEDAYEKLQQIKSILAEKGADFTGPCGKEDDRECHLLKHLSTWNDVMIPINVRITAMVTTKELELCFPKVFYVEQQPRELIEYAVILLHLILIKHTCVTKIELEMLGEFNDPEWFALLCDGIADCWNLKTFRVTADITGAVTYRQLLKACSTLQCLEELSFKKICDTEDARNMTILTSVIACNTKLRLLEVDGFDAVTKGKSNFLSTLQRSQCLSRLSLDVTTFGAEEASSLLQFLSGKKGLKSLRLKSNGLNRSITVHSIASVLSNATDLVDLELDGFFIYTHDAWLLAMTLVQLQMVQNLVLVQCIPIFSSLVDLTGFEANGSSASVSKRIEPYIHIVRGLTSLRSLALDLVRFPIEDQRAFLEALAGNNFLQHVSVAPPKRGYSSELSRMLIETGTANRICCGSVVTHETNWNNARVIP
ncbi:uncharacterized protein LOC142813893 [Rhipicephalus microplus]|uniref:uncharacterized protein LOC142813893 n=1 Tax=Rhipicephalus microplus TaxID=6941 RepID=UPI003F6D9807